MANGTQDYALGEVKARVGNNERRINVIENEQKEQQTWIDKTSGNVATIKYIMGFIGVGVIANFIQGMVK